MLEEIYDLGLADGEVAREVLEEQRYEDFKERMEDYDEDYRRMPNEKIVRQMLDAEYNERMRELTPDFDWLEEQIDREPTEEEKEAYSQGFLDALDPFRTYDYLRQPE